MRSATITPAGGDAYVLGDDAAGRGPGAKFIVELAPTFSGQSQIVRRPRASKVTIFDRGNEEVSYRLVVQYEFATAQEAFAFAAGLPIFVPRFGAVRLISDGQTVTIPSAYLRPVSTTMIGTIVVEAIYSISGDKPEIEE